MQKFIVTSDGRLKYGDVNMHKDLLDKDEACIGGGMYQFDYINRRLLLEGKSYDYGRPKWAYLDVLYMPESLRGFEPYWEGIPLTDFLPIKYV